MEFLSRTITIPGTNTDIEYVGEVAKACEFAYGEDVGITTIWMEFQEGSWYY